MGLERVLDVSGRRFESRWCGSLLKGIAGQSSGGEWRSASWGAGRRVWGEGKWVWYLDV